MSFTLHVDIGIKYILKNFQLSYIMTIETTCILVKDLDLYITETAYKFIKVSLVIELILTII